jgi:hypothetical protein
MGDKGSAQGIVAHPDALQALIEGSHIQRAAHVQG